MSDGEDQDAMQAMMGFSSFGTTQRSKKEPKESATGEYSASGANSAPIAKRAKTTELSSKLGPLSSSPPIFWPASLPPPPKSAISAQAPSFTPTFNKTTNQQPSPPGIIHQPPGTERTWFAPPQRVSQPSQSRPAGPPAYTNSTSGVSFTQQELYELKRGKKNERGDTMFFQPSFVDDDPWKALKKGTKVGT